MHRGQLPTTCCRHARVDGPQRPSGRTALPPAGTTPHHHHVADPHPTRAVYLDKHGRPRAQPADSASTAPVKRSALGPQDRPTGDRAPALALERNERGRAKSGHVNQQQKGA